MAERREAKKRETRERISDVATALFFERGFEAVTVDEIAAAAKVSKMTVFNYFPRKEDLMLDRADDLLFTPFRTALATRAKSTSPAQALRVLVAWLAAANHPLTRVDKGTARFWRLVDASPSLTARLHEFFDQATDGLATELARTLPEGTARLVAGILVLTVRTARAEAIRVFERSNSAKKASAAFFAMMDRGLDAIRAAT